MHWTHLLLLFAPALDDTDDCFSALASAGDVDGDGIPDLLVASRHSRAEHRSGLQAAVWILSGADGKLIRELRPRVPCRRFGSALAGNFDADGDGLSEVLIGADDHPFVASDGEEFVRRGVALVFRGADGELMYELRAPAEARAFGYSVAAGADLDGDGRGDLAVGAPDTDGGGRVYTYSGATGELLAELRSDASRPGDRCGHSLAFVPDLDGDGIGELLVGARGNLRGWVELRSGADGRLLRRIEHEGERIGWIVGSPGDVNADGTADLFTSALNKSFRIYSGADGALLHAFDYSGGYLHSEGSSADGLGDALFVYSSASGETLTTVELKGATEGIHVALTADLDGDGLRDLALATLERDAPLRIVSSRTGKELATLPGGPAGVDLGAAPDIDGVPQLAVLRRGRFALELVPLPARGAGSRRDL